MERHAFVMFGPAHGVAVLLAVVAPLLLAAMVRRGLLSDRAVRCGLALLLLAGWLGWYLLFAARGWLSLGNALPLNLCDWADAALICALLRPGLRAYELGYFWGLCATLEGLATPDIAYGFPDPQFLLFMVNHGGIIAALLYLTLGTGLRPATASLPRVLAATLGYALVAGTADALLGTNYGFLRMPPAQKSLIGLLSSWPWYIPEMAAIGIASALLCYAPFAIRDVLRRQRT